MKIDESKVFAIIALFLFLIFLLTYKFSKEEIDFINQQIQQNFMY